jgi:hypothetical protein
MAGNQAFTTVVVGDEPAGLWLMRQLYDVGIPGGKPTLGWVRLEVPRLPVCFPASFAKPFGISGSDTWYPEVLTPHHRLSWDPKTLSELFPELPPASRPSLAMIRKTIRRRPEILAYAAGIWRVLGRTERLNPEGLVLGALHCAGLLWWDVAGDVPAGVQRIGVIDNRNPIESMKREGTGWAMKFRQWDEPIVAERWVFNLPLHQLRWMCRQSPELVRALRMDVSVRAPHSLFGLRVRGEKGGIPFMVRPLTIAFDTDEIPDLMHEVWPIVRRDTEQGHELTVWVSGFTEPALEATLSNFRMGMQRLNQLFPFLGRSLLQIGLPLDVDTCFSDEHRADVLDTLETGMIEYFQISRLHAQTGHRAVHALLPYIQCHLPYPLGPLFTARKLLEEWAGKKRLRAYEAEQTRSSQIPA